MSTSVESVANNFFDYIICGGGTAGLTLAARLSEEPQTSVLVLEAGGENLNDATILRPAGWGSHFSNNEYAWTYQTTKQKHVGDAEQLWFRGKGLGGSSAINFMCWTKPPAEEINDFEKLGSPGWNWGNYEKYLSKTEGFVPPSADVQKRNRMCFDAWRIGTQGPLKVSYPGTIDEAELHFQQTLINAGLPIAPHPVSGDPKGVFFAPNTYDPSTHTRSYATTAFYLPNKDRANLTVLTSASVNRMHTDTTMNGKLSAMGVEFLHGDKTYIVNAKKEVILSAGALKSPHILELSGIGRKDVLEKINVPARIELPGVGQNAQEHVFVGISFELRDDCDFETVDLLRDPTQAAKHLELHATGSGIHTKGIVGFGFVPLNMLSAKAEEIYQAAKEKIARNAHTYPPGLLEQYEIQLERLRNGAPGCELISFPGYLSSPNPPAEGKRYLTVIVAMNHCFSRGTIHAISSDPRKDPEFDPHYMEEEVDLDIWCEAVRFARGLAEIAPFKDMIVSELNPGPKVDDDAQLREWIKKNFVTTWHTAGSCSMLPLSSGGVVDPELKVYGTNNIRVVDLSVVPLQFAAHPQATVYAIAEQAADIIKGKFQETPTA
ncbi:GMC oxidoreductase [Laetiporus sulphureus 93-53]|uniref:GMC oxidoreductase n=1 Tax=Laetiporus sulphureus 93-53 TaxID=1314785 RepID=A0A165DSK0_9APHY|nr:GMC oxidoreductase [Laetiporus sulphureus 93-53]KZT05544.1 GMC oxidoreductase [Laetiporus sulphureus 93-53]